MKNKSLPVTYGLILINILVYALQHLIPGAWIYLMGAYNPLYVEYSGEWWRAFTSGFIHSQTDISHLLMNMLTLYLFGQALEPRMQKWQYLAIYLLSILGGSAMILYVANMSGQMNITTIGASGGVFGLFGAYFAFAKLTQQSTLPILILVSLNFGYGFLVGNVSWEAHLGGLITGALVAFGLAALYRRQYQRAVKDAQEAAYQHYLQEQAQ